MPSRVIAATIALLFVAVIGVVFWLGAAGREAPPLPAPTISMGSPPAHGTPTPAAPAPRAPQAAVPALVVPPMASEKEREQTLAQRKAALPVFLKAADEGMSHLQKEIDAEKAQGGPAADIAEKEQQLQHMQDARQKVLARNADIRI